MFVPLDFLGTKGSHGGSRAALERIAANPSESADQVKEVVAALSAAKAEEQALSRWIIDLANVRPVVVDDTLAAYRGSVATVLAFFLSFYFVVWMGAKNRGLCRSTRASPS
jgi:hypothetical protein